MRQEKHTYAQVLTVFAILTKELHLMACGFGNLMSETAATNSMLR